MTQDRTSPSPWFRGWIESEHLEEAKAQVGLLAEGFSPCCKVSLEPSEDVLPDDEALYGNAVMDPGPDLLIAGWCPRCTRLWTVRANDGVVTQIRWDRP